MLKKFGVRFFANGVRVCRGGSVVMAMPVYSASLIPLAAWLFTGSGPVSAAGPAELPSGDSEVFRMRMMEGVGAAPAMEPPGSSAITKKLKHERKVTRVRAAAQVTRMPRLTSRFGYRVDPIRGGRRLHAGIDIPGPLGTPVQSSASGYVTFAGVAGGYGNMVEIDHGGGLRTRYGHLSRILVGRGAAVSNGETIALMGSTGRSTGSHLHFEVRSNGQPQNPLAYLGGNVAANPESFVEHTMIENGPLEMVAPHVSDFARRRAKAGSSTGAGG